MALCQVAGLGETVVWLFSDYEFDSLESIQQIWRVVLR